MQGALVQLVTTSVLDWVGFRVPYLPERLTCS